MLNAPSIYFLSEDSKERLSNIELLAFDFDGYFTNIQTNKIYELLYETAIGFLPKELEDSLKQYDISKIVENTKMSIGWYSDLEHGNLVLVDSEGKVREARSGMDSLTIESCRKIYGDELTVDVSQTDSPDLVKPRFYPIIDGFDRIEAFLLRTLSHASNGQLNNHMDAVKEAWYQTHNGKENYKNQLLKNPKKYGIVPNKRTIEFLKKTERKKLLITTSESNYVGRMLEICGLEGCFDEVITERRKPAVFLENEESNIILQTLARYGVRPENVLYAGDHLYKDALAARHLGFFSGLRLRKKDMDKIETKLEKYEGIKFRKNRRIATRYNIGTDSNLGLYKILDDLVYGIKGDKKGVDFFIMDPADLRYMLKP